MDHKTLVHIFSPGIELPGVVPARLPQYSMLLSTIDFAIEHIKGMHNLNANTLLRLPVDDIMLEEDSTDTLIVQFLSQSEKTAKSSTFGNFPQSGNYSKDIGKILLKRRLPHKRNDFSLRNSPLLCGVRLVLPLLHQKTFLNELYLNH
ncbi:unnamed protein product [Lepeophtheirus salmonis]|uniref:(salmon louse) hypothetical protein n=1 Tax=Lepeophtheirus salmonis TaxID=72036 RepID=A0A7R8CXR0_LEPSM|nr:unnamed protein product [Lepeophtheirus salmonis]CAF2934925.1 unnamed protein product [Lepeophtheirus salmonis]